MNINVRLAEWSKAVSLSLTLSVRSGVQIPHLTNIFCLIGRAPNGVLIGRAPNRKHIEHIEHLEHIECFQKFNQEHKFVME